MFRRWRIALILSAVMTVSCVAFATDPEISAQVKIIHRALAQNVLNQQAQKVDLEPSRKQLALAVDGLAAFLDKATPEVRAGWRDYLNWNELVEQITKPNADTEVLKNVLLPFRRYRTGLEMVPFQEVRNALQLYIQELYIYRAISEKDSINHCLEDLAHALARYEHQPNYEDAHRIGRQLYHLERSVASSRKTVEPIRERFLHPNLYGRVSHRLINRLLSREVYDEMVIDDSGDRRQTRGQATTKVRLRASLIKSSQQAAIDLILEGQCRAPRTITQQGSITIHGSFVSNVNARKRIHLNKEGISFQPAEATASTSVRIHNIAADRRILELIARRRAPRKTPEAEADVSRKTSEHVKLQLNRQAESELQEANHVFMSHFRTPNQCFGTFPELMQFSTTPRDLQLHARAANAWQLGAPQAPPTLNAEYDLGFAIHESMIGNYAEGLFGGKEITDKQWLTCLNTLTGSEPRALWVHDRTEPWSLTFSDQRPIVVHFHNGQFRITVRAKQIDLDGHSFHDPIDISSTFRIEVTDNGPVLFRSGEVSVDFVDAHNPTKSEQQLLDFISRKFGAIMPPELYFDGLVPPTGGALSMLRSLQPKEFSFQEGWMKIGYQLLKNRKAERIGAS